MTIKAMTPTRSPVLRKTVVARSLAAALLTTAAFVTAAAAVELPVRKAGLWETRMIMSTGRTMTMSQCTDASTDKDMVTLSNPAAQECSNADMQKTATGYIGNATCKMGNMTMTSHSEVSGDFNAAYTVKMATKIAGAPAGVPAESNITLDAKWMGPCKGDQKPGDIVMPGGMKMNIKDMQALKNMVPKH
jgi:hypothetical protein